MEYDADIHTFLYFTMGALNSNLVWRMAFILYILNLIVYNIKMYENWVLRDKYYKHCILNILVYSGVDHSLLSPFCIKLIWICEYYFADFDVVGLLQLRFQSYYLFHLQLRIPFSVSSNSYFQIATLLQLFLSISLLLQTMWLPCSCSSSKTVTILFFILCLPFLLESFHFLN